MVLTSEFKVCFEPGEINGMAPICMQSGSRHLYYVGVFAADHRIHLEDCLTLPTFQDAKESLCEALLSLYGAFAGVIVDTEEEKAILFHDINGIMPLFFTQEGNSLRVATEFRAFVRDFKSLELDQAALFSYLYLGTVLPPHTMWMDIKALERNAIIEISLSDLERPSPLTHISLGRYLSCAKFSKTQEAIDSLEDALLRAVCKQSTDKREIGVFLSGGVDSGLLAALLHQCCGKRVYAYTIGPWGERSSDLKTARLTGRQEAVSHREYFASRADLNHLPNLVSATGQPNSDLSTLAFYLLSKLAAQDGIDHVLSGQNADTSLGSISYVASLTWLAQLQNCIPSNWRHNVLRWLSLTDGLLEGKRLKVRYFLSDWQETLLLLKSQRFGDYAHLVYRQIWNEPRVDLLKRVNDKLEAPHSVDDRIILADTLFLESPRCLQAMFFPPLAYGVLTIFPYYSPSWIQSAWRIPRSMRRGSSWLNWDKPLLRKLASRYLPSQIATKPPKALIFPVQKWFSASDISSFVRFIGNKSVLLREILLPSEFLESALHIIWRWDKVVAANVLLKWLILEVWYRVVVQDQGSVEGTTLQEFLDWPLWNEGAK